MTEEFEIEEPITFIEEKLDETKCMYCGREATLTKIFCGACHKNYHGHFCIVCREVLKVQRACYLTEFPNNGPITVAIG